MNDNLKQFYKDNISESASLSPEAKNRVKNHVLANLHTTPVVMPVSFWENLRSKLPKTYVLAPLVVILFLAGTGIASANALPGDPLYTVKRHIENARIIVTPNEEAKLELQVEYAEKRLKELEKVTEREQANTPQQPPDDSKQIDEDNRTQRLQNERKIKAKHEAEEAVKFLRKTQEDSKKRGDDKRVLDIDNRLKNFRIEINNRDDSNDSDHDSRDNSGSGRTDRDRD